MNVEHARIRGRRVRDDIGYLERDRPAFGEPRIVCKLGNMVTKVAGIGVDV